MGENQSIKAYQGSRPSPFHILLLRLYQKSVIIIFTSYFIYDFYDVSLTKTTAFSNLSFPLRFMTFCITKGVLSGHTLFF